MTELECSSLVQCVKDIKKLTNGLNDLVVNVHIKDKSMFNELGNKIEKVEHKVDMLIEKDNMKEHHYTDAEIYELKKYNSWQYLSARTHIPVSTLRYRYKRYIESIDREE